MVSIKIVSIKMTVTITITITTAKVTTIKETGSAAMTIANIKERRH